MLRRITQYACRRAAISTWSQRSRSIRAGLEYGVVLATVKVWPVGSGASIEVGAAANLDGVCARRLRTVMPGKDNYAMRGIATLDEKDAENPREQSWLRQHAFSSRLSRYSRVTRRHLAAIVQNLKTLSLRLIRPPPTGCVRMSCVASVGGVRPKPDPDEGGVLGPRPDDSRHQTSRRWRHNVGGADTLP